MPPTDTLLAILTGLQIFSGIAWCLPVVTLFPAFLHVWRKSAGMIDIVRLPLLFAAIVQVGFSVRWLIWSHSLPVMDQTELSAWAALYFMNGVAAIAFTVTNRHAERLR